MGGNIKTFSVSCTSLVQFIKLLINEGRHETELKNKLAWHERLLLDFIVLLHRDII